MSHTGFHKHGAYILQNADMPGFSAQEQQRLSFLVLGCRGGLVKMAPALADATFRAQLFALRLAVLLHHSRREIALPRWRVAWVPNLHFALPVRWRSAHPLTVHLLARERAEWAEAGFGWR